MIKFSNWIKNKKKQTQEEKITDKGSHIPANKGDVEKNENSKN